MSKKPREPRIVELEQVPTSCKSCRYWNKQLESYNEKEIGLCKLYPVYVPQSTDLTKYGPLARFLVTYHDDYCSNHTSL